MIRNTLPPGLVDNPRLEQWIGFEKPGRVVIATGKVELGQGILTALTQIAADELDVDPARIVMVSGDTRLSPSEGVTAGSMSVETSGGAIRLVAAEVRSLLLAAAANRLKCDMTDLSIDDGIVIHLGGVTRLDYWSLSDSIDLAAAATGAVPVKTANRRKFVGTNLPRIDLPAKVFGKGTPFIHDVRSADMLHARVIRQPWPEAQFVAVDPATAARLLGVGVRLLEVGNFVAVTGDHEQEVGAAAERIGARITWTGGRPLDGQMAAQGWIAAQPSHETTTTYGQPAPFHGTAQLAATYSKPFIAHASIAPSCALASFEDGVLTVSTHSQGVVPLRVALARALGLDVEKIRIRHIAGAGCYGHNGADDSACDAAIIATHNPDRTVRVEWSRADELSSAPFGTAMVVALQAEVAADGRPTSWKTEIWSGPHVQRPGANGGVNLLGASALPNPPLRVAPIELPEAAGSSGMRNARLLYDIPQQTIVNHIVPDMALRTSSMRGLGAFANVFAIESFVDELAAAAGVDPVRYRLNMTSDTRARAVMEKAASMANWHGRRSKREGHGRGFAFSRYKNRAGYLALVVDVRVDDEVRLEKVWCAADAGLVINPDGVRNQVEGGIIQAASWTLKEQVLFEDGRVASRTWDQYPILRFSKVPEIEIALLDHPDEATLGVGEVAQGPTAAAIANAIADALGVRIRDLPLTRERIVAAASRDATHASAP
jgi:nicotinate dehydrogenase subunit B